MLENLLDQESTRPVDRPPNPSEAIAPLDISHLTIEDDEPVDNFQSEVVEQVRVSVGRKASPSLSIIDSQSVKLGQKGGPKLGLMVIRR
jgi:hypothetical protein